MSGDNKQIGKIAERSERMLMSLTEQIQGKVRISGEILLG